MTKKKKLLLFLVCSSRIREDVGVVLCFPFIVFHDEFKTSSRSQLLGGAHSLNFVVNNFVFVYKTSSNTVQLLLTCQKLVPLSSGGGWVSNMATKAFLRKIKVSSRFFP